MSAGTTLAVIGAPQDPASASEVELLRLVAALVATGQQVRLVSAGADRLIGTVRDLPDDALAYLDGIAAFGVMLETLGDTALVEALAEARHVLCAASPTRSARPPLLEIDASWIAAARRDPAQAVAGFLEAGQVVRVVSTPTDRE